MTVTNLSSNNLSLKKLSSLEVPVEQVVIDPYKVTEWPTMPSMSQGDDKICIIVGINSIIGAAATTYGDAVFAFDAPTNAPGGSLSTIDWGDGNIETVSTASSVQHKYLYDNLNLTTISNDPLSSIEYKVALITVTPPSGYGFTSFSINHYGSDYSRPSGKNQTNPCLSIKIAGENISSMDLASNDCIREFEFVGTHSITSMRRQFAALNCLRKCKIDVTGVTELGNNGSATDGAFYFSRSLKYVTLTGDSSSLTTVRGLFNSCFSLKEAPSLDLSSCTSADRIFFSCYSLKKVPKYDLSSCTTMFFAFYQCYSIREYGGFTTSSSLTSTNSTFFSNHSLVKAPYFDTRSVTNMGNMFEDNFSLKYIPSYRVDKVTDFRNFVDACGSLERFPSLYPRLSPINNMSSAMTNCTSLAIIGYNDFSSCTSNSNCNFAPLTSDLTNLKRSLIVGPRGTHYYQYANLGPNALNEIYTKLKTRFTAGATINVTGNWGTSSDNPFIATTKLWTVTGS